MWECQCGVVLLIFNSRLGTIIIFAGMLAVHVQFP